jgi:delta 1-pyrroline-5-carboxylate dehydrogenase
MNRLVGARLTGVAPWPQSIGDCHEPDPGKDARDRLWPAPNAKAFVDGKFVDAFDGGTFATINPATGETICGVAHRTAADVDKAVSAARRSFRNCVWSRTTPEQRKAVLLKLADLVRKAIDQYLQTKTVWISRGIAG